jgi:hypothetical protein
MLFATAAVWLSFGFLAPLATGQQLVTPHQLSRSVDLNEISDQPNGAVSGTIVNRTSYPVRDVKLMIDYAWVWSNDFRPGENSPGRTFYITAPAEIPPHGQGSFTYQPSPPLESRDDGHFVPTVHIVGFTQMVPQG